MAAALRSRLGADDELAFRSDLLDSWQLLELESTLQPALTLLGYRPFTELERVSRMRHDADAYKEARVEVAALRAELATLRAESQLGVSAGEPRARDAEPADVPADLKTLRWKAKRYDQIRAAASPLLRLKHLRSRRD
jgi:hypothetical protein